MLSTRFMASLALAALLSGCSAPAAAPADPLSLVVFGDSWSYGAHCGGCTPWPRLLPASYESSVGVQVELTDLTENGGTSDSLIAELRNDVRYRGAVADADIVVFNMGSNDEVGYPVDPAALGERWEAGFDRMLDIVAELRGDKATAVRMVGLSNEYLWDGGLRVALGKAAPDVMAAFNDASCAAASGHGGRCVDLRPVLTARR